MTNMLQEEVWIYTSGLYNVTIPAGASSVPFDISINNDNILECDEYFMLTIKSILVTQ